MNASLPDDKQVKLQTEDAKEISATVASEAKTGRVASVAPSAKTVTLTTSVKKETSSADAITLPDNTSVSSLLIAAAKSAKLAKERAKAAVQLKLKAASPLDKKVSLLDKKASPLVKKASPLDKTITILKSLDGQVKAAPAVTIKSQAAPSKWAADLQKAIHISPKKPMSIAPTSPIPIARMPVKTVTSMGSSPVKIMTLVGNTVQKSLSQPITVSQSLQQSLAPSLNTSGISGNVIPLNQLIVGKGGQLIKLTTGKSVQGQLVYKIQQGSTAKGIPATLGTGIHIAPSKSQQLPSPKSNFPIAAAPCTYSAEKEEEDSQISLDSPAKLQNALQTAPQGSC